MHMETFTKIILSFACVSIVFLFYFRTLKQLFRRPKLIIAYIVAWIVIMIGLSILIEKLYFESNKTLLENKDFIEV